MKLYTNMVMLDNVTAGVIMLLINVMMLHNSVMMLYNVTYNVMIQYAHVMM